MNEIEFYVRSPVSNAITFPLTHSQSHSPQRLRHVQHEEEVSADIIREESTGKVAEDCKKRKLDNVQPNDDGYVDLRLM